jgi:hypothetical protein
VIHLISTAFPVFAASIAATIHFTASVPSLSETSGFFLVSMHERKSLSCKYNGS